MDLQCGMKVLDFGSGDSFFPIYLASKGMHVHSVDLSSSQLPMMEQVVTHSKYGVLINKKLKYIFCDKSELPIENDSFDRVFTISTLEHIKENGDTKIVEELSRILKPGGKMFISVEFHQDFMEIIVPPKYKKKKSNKTGSYIWENLVRYYNKKALFERIISPSGLNLEEMIFFGSPKINIRKYADTNFFLRFGLIFSPLLSKLCYRRVTVEKDFEVCAKASPSYFSNIIVCIILSKK